MRDLEHGEGGDPGGEPGQAHQRQPDEEREQPAEPGREQERRHVPDRVVAQQREQRRQHALLRLERHRHHARGERADGDEADLPEREHARVADEDVDRDDDRDRDERVQEVDLVRRRGGGRDEPDGDDEQRRPGELDERVEPASYALGRRPAPQANSPAGRRSSTRITSAKTADGR